MAGRPAFPAPRSAPMKRTSVFLLSFVALAACSEQAQSPVASPAGPLQSASGKYIVVFNDESFSGPRFSVAGAITEVAEGQRVKPSHVYSAALEGFAAELTEG